MKYMSEGMDRNSICQAVAEEEKISPRTVEAAYYRVVDAMSAQLNEGRAELRAHLLSRVELLFRRAVSEKAYKTALDAVMAQARLGGLLDQTKDDAKRPEIITITERDYSAGPVLVGETAENE